MIIDDYVVKVPLTDGDTGKNLILHLNIDDRDDEQVMEEEWDVKPGEQSRFSGVNELAQTGEVYGDTDLSRFLDVITISRIGADVWSMRYMYHAVLGDGRFYIVYPFILKYIGTMIVIITRTMKQILDAMRSKLNIVAYIIDDDASIVDEIVYQRKIGGGSVILGYHVYSNPVHKKHRLRALDKIMKEATERFVDNFDISLAVSIELSKYRGKALVNLYEEIPPCGKIYRRSGRKRYEIDIENDIDAVQYTLVGGSREEVEWIRDLVTSIYDTRYLVRADEEMYKLFYKLVRLERITINKLYFLDVVRIGSHVFKKNTVYIVDYTEPEPVLYWRSDTENPSAVYSKLLEVFLKNEFNRHY